MKRKLLFVFMIAAVFATAGSALADVILPPGVDEYRIIFVTSGKIDAISSDIGEYNTHAVREAELSATLFALNADWYCVGSTAAVDARDNLSTGITWQEEHIPIYNTAGQRVGDDLGDIFDGALATAVSYDQHGVDPDLPGQMWTGSMSSGICGNPLGREDGPATYGLSSSTSGHWLSDGDIGTGAELSIYAMSSSIPEAATVGLLGFGGLALLRRRRSI